MHAIDLAKLQEDKYSELTSLIDILTIIILIFHINPQLHLLPKPQNSIPVRKLSSSNYKKKERKGSVIPAMKSSYQA